MQYLKIKTIFILGLGIIFGLPSLPQSFAQQGSPQSVEVAGYTFNTADKQNMVPVAYGVVVSKKFNDADSGAHWLDPSGDSVLESLRVMDGINFDYDQFTVGAPFLLRHITSAYFINFDDAGTDGHARYNFLRAFKFHMEDDGPLHDLDAQRGGGKFVWDIAEAVLVAEGEPGDVVVISSDEDITLIKSKKKFDVKVAGVISTDPKIYMGYQPEAKKEDGYKPLSLAGIVLCNVTAENGAIKKGDILVSSSSPGHAMRADPEQVTPGMMLGSALGSLEQGEGKIYILIN